ncbi:hypothetical protein H0R92_08280 [Treponema sp. OMZ 840]|uniref:hypothetical protein n=1 Tax=Treponema sp. OMZ 840 TaxID=244313 RepID=UPI003D92087C
MTVSAKNAAAENIPLKILEIRRKINDTAYVDNAVQRIALVLSREIAGKPCRFKEVIL